MRKGSFGRVACCVAAVLFSGVRASADVGQSPNRCKFVAAGWDLEAQTPESVLRSANLLSKTGLDGISIGFPKVMCRDGKTRNFHWGTMTAMVGYEDLRSHIPAMRELVRGGRLSESFVMTCWTPVGKSRRLDWRDDAVWRRVADNMALAARIAKEAGWRGLFCDNEDYSHKAQYVMSGGDLPYKQMRALARKRGSEIGSAVFAAYPNIRLFFFWGLTFNKAYRSSVDPAGSMVQSGDLWPAFLDGLFDVMPPTAVFIDGNEHAYDFRPGSADFAVAAKDALVRLPALLSPENRGKYRAQMQVSFGQFMNIFVNEKRKTQSEKAAMLRQALQGAAASADEYVWLWGEKCKWVDWPDFRPAYPHERVTNATWAEELPGLPQILENVRNPLGRLNDRFEAARAGGTPNLIASKIKNWRKCTWKAKDDPGTFDGASDGSVVRMTGTREGDYTFECGVMPGKTYLCGCRYRSQGTAHCEVRWKANGKWAKNGPIVVAEPPDDEGWRRARVEAVAPEGIDGLVWIFEAHLEKGEIAEFADAVVYEAED